MSLTTKAPLPYCGAPAKNLSSVMVAPSGPSKTETALAEARAEVQRLPALVRSQRSVLKTCAKVMRPYLADDK